MSKELIPFVILEAHPDYKRPYVLPFFGMIQEDKLDNFLLEKLVEFVYNRIDMSSLNSVNDIEKFWEQYYSDIYMDNPPWQATAIINGIWEDINPSNEELFEGLKKEKKKNSIYISSDSDNSDDDVKTVESIIIEDDSYEDSGELSMEKILEPVYDI